MLNYIKENIIQSQELAKSKINLLLESYGYSLTKDEHNKKGVETRLIQWENVKNNHSIELIWDGKEDWFDLREFESIDNLNYNSSKQITLVKFYRAKWLNRRKYLCKITDSLIDELKEKLNKIKHK